LLPAPFLEQMQSILGDELPEFLHALESPSPVSIRVNPMKRFILLENYEKVKWNSEGIYLPERPVFTLDPLFHAGAYYVQEASSMFIAEAVRQLVDTGRYLRVLDMCAAPGGKSTLLASVIGPGSLLLSNEVIRSRYEILRENLVRWGYPNTHHSNHDSRDFGELKGFFDLVLVDAPCSGEGLFRKDPGAIEEWSPANVELCAGRQRRILAEAAQLVRPGGFFIYCTCTYNDRENTANSAWIAKESGLEIRTLKIPDEWGIREKQIGYQFYPHLTEGEGFYIACFRKKEGSEKTVSKLKPVPGLSPLPSKLLPVMKDWIAETEPLAFFIDRHNRVAAFPENQLADIQLISNSLRNFQPGFEVGVFKQSDFIPSHSSAMSILAAPGLPHVNVDRMEALRFLKKENFDLDPIPEGWQLVRYKGHNLGWIKGLKNRINNYYPKEWRIRMEIG
jgi:16S rRNA C967 or C1407 C5-methylase (RsmB/RsmF family)/NOL1/NOP2/fmu family ribosome biogenesis protein